MKCPVCDTENAPGLTVCDMCGSELPEGKECKGCGAIIPKNVAYCPHCKALADVKPASSSTNSGMPMYFVALDDVGDDRQEVIKVVQAIRGCSFEEAREIIDGDGIVLNEVPKLEAEIAVSKLRGAGADAGMEEIDYELDDILSDNSNRGSNRSSSRSSSSSSANKSSKSKLVAGLLAFFVGGIGIHNFYLGHTGKGILQLLLCFTGISSIWAFIEMIMIFTGSITDSDGNPLA